MPARATHVTAICPLLESNCPAHIEEANGHREGSGATNSYLLFKTAYNARMNPVWGASGLVGAVAGPVGAAAPVGPAVKAPWSVSKRSTWPNIYRSTPPPDSRQVRFRHRQ
eukprot:COSAG06_NODE_14355_length_1163_cov_5.219925_2_plen_110_part_01